MGDYLRLPYNHLGSRNMIVKRGDTRVWKSHHVKRLFHAGTRSVTPCLRICQPGPGPEQPKAHTSEILCRKSYNPAREWPRRKVYPVKYELTRYPKTKSRRIGLSTSANDIPATGLSVPLHQQANPGSDGSMISTL